MAATAAIIGAMANTLRLSLVDYAYMAPALAAFIGALLAGLLASVVRQRLVSKNFDYGSINRNYGSRTIHVSCSIQFWDYQHQHWCLLDY